MKRHTSELLGPRGVTGEGVGGGGGCQMA